MSETSGFNDYVRHEEEVIGEDGPGATEAKGGSTGSTSGSAGTATGSASASSGSASSANRSSAPRQGGQSESQSREGNQAGQDNQGGRGNQGGQRNSSGGSQQTGLIASLQNDAVASAKSQPLTTFFLAVLFGYIFGRLRILPF